MKFNRQHSSYMMCTFSKSSQSLMCALHAQMVCTCVYGTVILFKFGNLHVLQLAYEF